MKLALSFKKDKPSKSLNFVIRYKYFAALIFVVCMSLIYSLHVSQLIITVACMCLIIYYLIITEVCMSLCRLHMCLI